MKKLSAHSLLAILFALLFSTISCKKSESDNTGSETPVPNAKITGVVHSPSGKLIGAAEIIAGNYRTKSNRLGAFELNVPEGTYDLIIQTGDGNVFKSIVNCSVGANQTLVLSYVQSSLLQVGTMAYLPGSWDKIERIIIDSLGYVATSISLNDFSNFTLLTSYDAIFLNCGALNGLAHMDSTKYANLNSYLSGGGSIYASDYAVRILTGDGYFRPSILQNSIAWKNNDHSASGTQLLATCVSGQLGGFIEDSSLCTQKIGTSGMVYNATITDANIISLLGKDSMDIEYDLGSWERINHLDAPFTSLIEDNSFSGYGPLVAFTDVNNKTPGGKIFYTTFHNEPQGVVSSDVQLILEYFILNL
jgi:hypothetical protein